jgi:hypothetical protein
MSVHGIKYQATSVLKEIEAAVGKRLPSDPEPARKRDRLFASIRQKATDAKRRYTDPEGLDEMRRKIQNVVDGFMVSTSFTLDATVAEELSCTSRSPLCSATS